MVDVTPVTPVYVSGVTGRDCVEAHYKRVRAKRYTCYTCYTRKTITLKKTVLTGSRKEPVVGLIFYLYLYILCSKARKK